MDIWYRTRLDCPLVADWSKVRAYSIARALCDYTRVGIANDSVKPAVFDCRFFPWPFDEKQSKLSDQDKRALLLWAARVWPDWSLDNFHITKYIIWLEVLNHEDQQLVLSILRKYYGL